MATSQCNCLMTLLDCRDSMTVVADEALLSPLHETQQKQHGGH